MNSETSGIEPSAETRETVAELNKPILQALLLIDSVNQSENGKKNLNGVFGLFILPHLPIAISYSVFLKWQGQIAGEFSQRIEILDPEGLQLAEFKAPCIIPEDFGAQEVVLRFEHFPIKKYGRFSVKVYLDEQLAGTTWVISQKPPELKEI